MCGQPAIKVQWHDCIIFENISMFGKDECHGEVLNSLMISNWLYLLLVLTCTIWKTFVLGVPENNQECWYFELALSEDLASYQYSPIKTFERNVGCYIWMKEFALRVDRQMSNTCIHCTHAAVRYSVSRVNLTVFMIDVFTLLSHAWVEIEVFRVIRNERFSKEKKLKNNHIHKSKQRNRKHVWKVQKWLHTPANKKFALTKLNIFNFLSLTN